MHIVVVGVNHKKAPVELRERMAVDEAHLDSTLASLRADPRVNEACIVSTCNRTEVYAVTLSRADDELFVDFLAKLGGIDRAELNGSVYRRPGRHAVKHLFEVACGLDSLALGETQILGQIKNAFRAAHQCGGAGCTLNNLFQQALTVGKRARTETGISSDAFSIGAAAPHLARLVLGHLTGRKALLIGAGQMSKLAATHLQANGIERIVITNRTRARAEPLARELGAEVIDYKRFGEALALVDVVITSTASRKPIITRELMARIMEQRHCAPIFLIDIAVPRDIEPGVADLEGAFVYNIDDLRFLVDRSRAEREAEVCKVRAIIEEQTAAFMAYLRTLEVIPVLQSSKV